ncbi:beta-ketoacyl-[acyl-carrier-protein] synthase II [bacterium]|nr:MAG: beta-ketoacyl-[acyl-carrier-protein] synthase II [bacterium]
MSDRPVPSGRVVVTGAGAVTPVGKDVETFWTNLRNGQSGIDRVTLVDPSPYACQIGGEVKEFDAAEWMDKKEARRVDRFIALGIAAATQAIQDSGLKFDEDLKNETGVMIGSGIGGLWTMQDQTHNLYEKGAGKVSPFWVPYMIANMASGMVSIMHDLRGPNVAPVTACSTGANAIGDAYHVIKRGDAVAMVAGGSEAAINDIGIAAFSAARAMSTRNDEPQRASRPFDVDRDGFVMGEGAAVLVLEDRDHAIARGAKIYGEILGYGMSADATHITNPHPEGRGASAAMRMALRNAGLTADQIDYVNAHGTSTPVGDIHEAKAIHNVFGEAATKVPVSSTKSMTGHTLGAAGAIETLVCLLAMRDSILPPTINVDNQDPEIVLDVVPNVAREHKITYALNNSFGFGGHNVSLIVGTGK